MVAGLPFMVVMIGMAVSLVKELATDPMIVREGSGGEGRRRGGQGAR